MAAFLDGPPGILVEVASCDAGFSALCIAGDFITNCRPHAIFLSLSLAGYQLGEIQ